MTPIFTARRKPKRPLTNTPREKSPPDASTNTNDEDESPVVVRKPLASLRKSSKLRTSQLSTPTVQTPQPQSVNATPEPENRTTSAQQTSSTTQQLPDNALSQPLPLAVDIASKFGSTATTSTSSAIPTPAQIAERKARRARLAKESQAALLSNNHDTTTSNENSITNNSDFVSLDAYDSDGEFKPSRLQVSSYLRDDRLAASTEYTRLVPEDEHGDFAEGFEEFVEPDDHHPGASTSDGRIHTSSIVGHSDKALRAKEREAMRTLIDRAEGHSIHSPTSDPHKHQDAHDSASDDSSDDSNSDSDSDASLNAAYTTSQTLKGTSMSHLSQSQRRQLSRDAIRPRAPEKTTTIPSVAVALERLRSLQTQADQNGKSAQVRVAEIKRRMAEIEGEKERIQRGLVEIGTQLEAVGGGDQQGRNGEGRGLDNIGGNGDVSGGTGLAA